MYTKWTEHLSDHEDKQRFQKRIQAAKPILVRLMEILDVEEKTLDRSELNVDQFDKPNWDYKQAFKNGYRAALAVQKKLIDLDQQELMDGDRQRRRPTAS